MLLSQLYELISCVFFINRGSVIIVAKNEAIAKAIAADPYLKKRKAPTEAEQQLYSLWKNPSTQKTRKGK